MARVDFALKGCICLNYLLIRAIQFDRLIHRQPDFSTIHFNALDWSGGGRNGLAVHNVCNFSRRPGLIDSPRPYRGGLKVDLTLRLNVLAVCAAIAFVGAVLIMF
jgi:hypothetical protein